MMEDLCVCVSECECVCAHTRMCLRVYSMCVSECVFVCVYVDVHFVLINHWWARLWELSAKGNQSFSEL